MNLCVYHCHTEWIWERLISQQIIGEEPASLHVSGSIPQNVWLYTSHLSVLVSILTKRVKLSLKRDDYWWVTLSGWLAELSTSNRWALIVRFVGLTMRHNASRKWCLCTCANPCPIVSASELQVRYEEALLNVFSSRSWRMESWRHCSR